MKKSLGPTTFILVGGNEFADPEYGVNISREVQQRAISSPRILNCFFATDKSRWQEKQEQVRKWWGKHFHDNENFQVALPDLFFDQINQSDIVYLHGGDTARLIETLKTLGVTREAFQGKIIIGSSAGANALVANAWSSLTQKPRKGLAIVDLNIMVHYGAPLVGDIHRTLEDWKNEEQQFRDLVVSDEPIIRLSEGKFIVVSD